MHGSDYTHVRTSKPLNKLSSYELYTRSQDPTFNPFRPIVRTRSSDIVRQRLPGHSLRVPHYTPSFVNGSDAGLVNTNTGAVEQLSRNLSWGGFWTVGGRGGLQLGQLHGVATGLGGLLASGTSAPLLYPSFLDQPTSDDKIRAHERRLALALNIDQATRALTPDPNATSAYDTHPRQNQHLSWCNGAWLSTEPISSKSGQICCLSPSLTRCSTSQEAAENTVNIENHSDCGVQGIRCSSSER